MKDIVIGRVHDLGDQGRILLGKHYVRMGQTTSLSNPIYLDVASSHVVLVVGKRGGGKSYTLGVIAEGMANLPPDVKNNLSVVILDTMGIFWTMKYPNLQDKQLLNSWGLEAEGLGVQIYTPLGFYQKYKDQGIPTDFPFSVKPSELDGAQWCQTFGISQTSEIGVLIERTIADLEGNFSMEDIKLAVKKNPYSEKTAKEAAVNLFSLADSWGVFDTKGTPIKELAQGGQVTVLDVSCYATMADGWRVKALVVGIVSQKLFEQRMNERKAEEFDMIHQASSFSDEEQQSSPMVWLIIDEAHEFLPLKGLTLASFPLMTILREGRQPGISLVMATQQPGKISHDAMTQADTVIAHRITAKIDTEALGALMQSYMREGLDVQLDHLPRTKGAALIFDDTNERLYPLQIRPRFTWHGGSAPIAVHLKKKLFEFSEK
ncbi:MAG: DUF87 domain-containing protein [Nanoarchaeota archaeon]